MEESLCWLPWKNAFADFYRLHPKPSKRTRQCRYRVRSISKKKENLKICIFSSDSSLFLSFKVHKQRIQRKIWKEIQMKRGPSFRLLVLSAFQTPLLKCLQSGIWIASHFRTLRLILFFFSSSFSLFLFSFLLRSNPASPDANNKTPIDFNMSRKYAVCYLPQPPQWISGKNSFIFIPTMPWKMGSCYFITSKLLL